MKKIVLGTLVLGVAAFASVNLGSCKSCHGANYEKANIFGSTSRALSSLTKEELDTALTGYKNKTIKGPKAGMMYGNAMKYDSATDLDAIVKMVKK